VLCIRETVWWLLISLSQQLLWQETFRVEPFELHFMVLEPLCNFPCGLDLWTYFYRTENGKHDGVPLRSLGFKGDSSFSGHCLFLLLACFMLGEARGRAGGCDRVSGYSLRRAFRWAQPLLTPGLALRQIHLAESFPDSRPKETVRW
jgi:hypothetical protein